MLRLLFAMLLGAAGAALCQGPAAAGEVDARTIHWQRSLADAKALAAATGRPLLLAMNMDGESASDRIVHEEYRDPAFVALTRKCVCVGASVFRHNARDHDDQGRRICCPRFPGITCGEHIALEPVVFDAYLADGERVAPRHAVVMPDGKKAFDLSLCFDLKDIDRALAAAVANVPAASDDAMPKDWNTLAARRDAAGRTALEAAVAEAQDEATIRDALAAIEKHGDAGSLDALRPLFARVDNISKQRLDLGGIAQTLDAGGAAALLRDVLQGLGAMPDDPGPGARERALLFMYPETLQQDFLVARNAVRPSRRIAERTDDARASIGLDLSTVLQVAGVVSRRDAALPRTGGPTDALPAQAELERKLSELDAAPASKREQAEWQAQFAKASLDLGRVRLAENHKGVALLFDDAARYFERATAAPGARCEWWIERARCAYFRSEFALQIECGRRALALAAGTEQMPADAELLTSPLLQDGNAIEALRWIGDGNARLIADRAKGPLQDQKPGMVDALRALAIVAVSPFGSDGDWTTIAGLCGSLGLLREQVAIAYAGAMRFPSSRDLRAALNAALWQSGRPDLMPACAEAIERAHAPSADSAWFAGYAWLLVAEDRRRCEDPRAAIGAYWFADEWFAQAAKRDERYRDDCVWQQAIAKFGQGMAHASAGDQRFAADWLIEVVGEERIKELRDGLGCDVFDLVDRILEWRARGPSEVTGDSLLTQMKVRADDPFWANAVSDAALREALRADGRNPERVEQETVDASGNKIRMPMGLPTAEGDEYLRQAIEAGRRAAAHANTDDDKKPLAQALTIAAERSLVRGTTDGIAALVTEAAPLVGLAPPAAGADERALRVLVTELRTKLGDARPRFRPGR